MKKLTIFIIISAIIVGILGFYYYQRNIYSKEVLRLEIIGEERVDLLDEVKYIVRYKNNGNIRLEEPELIFEYPENSIPTDENPLRVVKRAEELGGFIYPGQERTFTFTARLMGREGEMKEARASLAYRPKNLKARYTSETSFATVIERVPLNFDFDLVSRVGSGKELNFRLNYFSNIDYPVPNLRIIVDYPSGFEFIDAAPKPLDKTEWEIGLLNKSEGGRVEVSGRVEGAVGEEKIFRARIGSWVEDEFVLLKELSRGVTIIKPALYITQQINNNPKYVANPGGFLHYEIFFRNLDEEALTEAFLVVNLIGPAFDLQTIQAPEGDFTAGENSIFWDWKNVSDLRFLPAQSEGKVEFWVKLKDEWDFKSIADKNPEIRSRVFLEQAREDFVNKINSKLVVSQKAYFQDEIFESSGSVPPEVGETTDYTVFWQAKNYYNEVKDVKVKAVLPENVKLTSKIFPEEEADKITFDSQSREIVWNVGDMVVGQGILSRPPEIYFQISLDPKEDQKGDFAQLIGAAKVIGQDQWTGQTIQSFDMSVDTSLPDDQTISQEMGIVQ